MNKLFAVLIAGLFATSVYAQAPAAPKTVAPTAVKAEAGVKVAAPKAKAHVHKTAAKTKAPSKAKVHAKADTTAVKADVKVPAIK